MSHKPKCFRLPPYTDHRACCFCGPTAPTIGLQKLGDLVRVRLFIQHNIIANGPLKMCPKHVKVGGGIDITPANLGYKALGKKKRRLSEDGALTARLHPKRDLDLSDTTAFLSFLKCKNLLSSRFAQETEKSDHQHGYETSNILYEKVKGDSSTLRALFHVGDAKLVEELASYLEPSSQSSSSTTTSSSSLSSSSSPSSSSAPKKRGRPRGSLKHGLSYRDVVLVLLCHLSCGLRSPGLAALYCMPESTIRQYIQRAREGLADSSWCEEWLRFPRSLEELRSWTPQATLKKWNHTLLGVFDCTYVWLQNSKNVGKSSMRSMTHSTEQYKGQAFVKYLTFTAPNGRLLFKYGPFGANSSDNSILSQAINDNPALKDYLNMVQKDGMVFLDRGFNHTDQVFEKHGILAHFKIPGWTDQAGKFSATNIQKQYDLTSDRAVVEQFHGAWRRFTYFQLEVPMTQVPQQPTNNRSPMCDLVTVSMALSNYLYLASRT